MNTKTILALALLVAMLSMPSVLASPAEPHNPAAEASVSPDTTFPVEMPGFSEVGHQIAFWVHGGETPIWGVSGLAPGFEMNWPHFDD